MAQVKREQAQENIVALRKRADKAMFQLGDKVHMRNPGKGKWDKLGIITDVVKSQDDVAHSFLIKIESGEEYYRHQSYIRHST